jgi:sucrose-6-phosphate hydrolase SacC (GH32 family)
MKTLFWPCLVALLFWSAGSRAADDLVIADFEGTNYGAWKITGDAFGAGPARGTLPGQMKVDGFIGTGLVNSFVGGDKSMGTLASPLFKIERRYLSFFIGGGGYSNETCMNLLIDGKVVRTAIGPNTESGGSEQLQPGGWDVSEFSGREAVIEIVDKRTGGWGHINVDQIVQTDRKPALEQKDATREFVISKHYLHFPVKNGAPKKKVQVMRDGNVERFFDIELADAEPDWWAFLDVSAWRGQKLVVKVDRLRDGSRALESISQSDEAVSDIGGSRAAARDSGAAAPPYRLYQEPLRPRHHFTARRGWLNDPNGLVFYKGEYHLFFQHNPYGWSWGNMHWGHAVSRDLTGWEELGEALYPDQFGPMFSGSAVIDWNNTSGFGKDGEPPMVLIYTAAGNPTVQCLAYSTDSGRTFTKYVGNPVVKQFTPGNRDPKVIWHQPTKRWVMTLYVGFDENKDGRKSTRHTIHFLTSANLKDWKVTSQIEGFFECPDFFELPVDGDTMNRKWVLTAANSDYMLGKFDGAKFTSESPILKGHRGKGFYAAQTFSDIPASDGRRIQIGWLQAPSPGMPFNQCMSLPLELNLVSTSDGPRLAWKPAPWQGSDAHPHAAQEISLQPGETKSLTKDTRGFLNILAEFEPGVDSELKFTVNGVPIIYSASKQELSVNGHRAPAPLRNGKQKLNIITDRTAFEVFASDGLAYLPIPALWKDDARGVTVLLTGAPLKSSSFTMTELR